MTDQDPKPDPDLWAERRYPHVHDSQWIRGRRYALAFGWGALAGAIVNEARTLIKVRRLEQLLDSLAEQVAPLLILRDAQALVDPRGAPDIPGESE